MHLYASFYFYKMKKLLFIIFVVAAITSFAQPKNYTTANAHSHNDYEQAEPFYVAWRNGVWFNRSRHFFAG